MLSSTVDQWGSQLFTNSGQHVDVSPATHAVSTLDESRSDPRNHLFVAATLYSDAGSAPVRIRNMSQSGALIETSAVPDQGAAIMLKRGSLQASGQIIWKVEGKAGIAFSTRVSVADWLSRQGRAHQQQVDEIVSTLRSTRQHDCAHGPSIAGDTSVDTELQALRADLVLLGNGLARDAILVATHPEVQMVDIALQRIDRIIQQLRNSQSQLG